MTRKPIPFTQVILAVAAGTAVAVFALVGVAYLARWLWEVL